MRPLKKEIEVIAALLVEGDDTPEALAGKVIEAVDAARMERVTYLAVMRFPGPVFIGCGPYATRNQAEKAIKEHPAADMVRGYAVVPTVNAEGHAEMLRKLDTPPAPKGDWAEVRKDAQAFRNGWRGKAREREAHL